jgi:hypothetical protein
MADRPLNYASPGMRTKGAPTPEQVRFRQRMKRGLLIAFILGWIPYPTQVLPTIKIQFVDPNGKAVTDVVSVNWGGYSSGKTIEGHLQLDMSAQAAIPRQWIWSSPFGRAFNFLSAFQPHSGGFGGLPEGDVEFNMPSDYALDDQSMGLLLYKNWSTPTSQTWALPTTRDRIDFTAHGYHGRSVYITITEPGKWGAAVYPLKIILKPNPATTTRPSAGGSQGGM